MPFEKNASDVSGASVEGAVLCYRERNDLSEKVQNNLLDLESDGRITLT